MLEELFRSAHSLKGAARMLGVEGVETLAHHFEDELGAARRGHWSCLRQPRTASIAGWTPCGNWRGKPATAKPRRWTYPQVLAQLRGEDLPTAPAPADSYAEGEHRSSQRDAGAGHPADSAEQSPRRSICCRKREPLSYPRAELEKSRRASNAPAAMPAHGSRQRRSRAGIAVEELPARLSSHPPQSEPLAGSRRLTSDARRDEAQALVSPTAFKIETIRVEPQKLDALMTLAGEMAVTTTRVARALAVIGDLVALWEEWGRDASAHAFSACRSVGRPCQPCASRPSRNSSPVSTSAKRGGWNGWDTCWANWSGRATKESRDWAWWRTRWTKRSAVCVCLPFSTIFNLFPRLVRDLSREQGKEVRLVVEGGTIAADKHLLEEMKDPLMHMLRNAIDHGIELPDERVRQGKPREATLASARLSDGDAAWSSKSRTMGGAWMRKRFAAPRCTSVCAAQRKSPRCRPKTCRC